MQEQVAPLVQPPAGCSLWASACPLDTQRPAEGGWGAAWGLTLLSPQAIQHIEGTQEKQLLGEEEEEQRRQAVIVTPARASLDPSNSDTASDSEADDSDAMDHSKAEMP